jgi:hypothetical protein
MLNLNDGHDKEKLKTYLKSNILAGNIDVNIMTKVDKDNFDKHGNIIEAGSDAVSALRGYSKSTLKNSSIVFSAGMNPRVFNYLLQCKDFDINEQGEFDKKIIIKVSDYRSALIQGKLLAKKGIWVSEFRIESGLNCGGHAFATDGYLLGPILEEFKTKHSELITTMFTLYNEAIKIRHNKSFKYPPKNTISVQGGVGTHQEQSFLINHYNITSVGWGTPFLLVPEATTVDNDTLRLLSNAKKEDITLSYNSPLGVRFHNLKGTTSDKEKVNRINKKSPGSPCIEKHLAFNTEFTKEPICTASKEYQKHKLSEIQNLNLSEAETILQVHEVLAKECLCVGLSNAASLKYNLPFLKKYKAVTICPGPNIVNFSTIVSLKEMADHIYGKINIITNTSRQHMFLAELTLYIEYIKEQFNRDLILNLLSKKKSYYETYITNLTNGIEYYINLAKSNSIFNQNFISDINSSKKQLNEFAILI